jgi:ribonuclease P protein component
MGVEGEDRKLGVVVGRNVGGAVVRNRVKRFLREAFRHIKNEVLPGTHVVVRAGSKCGGASYAQLSDELRRLLGMDRAG